MGAQRVVFLGTNPVVQQIARRLPRRPELGLTMTGFIDDTPGGEASLPGVENLGPLSAFAAIVDRVKPDLIVVGMSERRERMPVHALLDLRFSGTRIEDAAITYETTFGRVCVEELRPSQLIFSSELGPRASTVRLQTVYSTIIALAGAIAAAPLMVLVAVLVRLTSRGPALFRQRRVGLHGRIFTLYKFRSMHQDAEAGTGAVWASRHDPRVTPLGRWLRRLRLDELPQLLNVLRGEMSIVGPRPERPEFVATLSEQIPFYRQRHHVKPGITGWAQVNHRYGDTLEDTITKLEYDLYYIKHLAPALDAYIIFHTLKVMMLSRGAQ
jgi:exopolysaccharide biosynthesis polyprenyl glycosylphosphotransferase